LADNLNSSKRDKFSFRQVHAIEGWLMFMTGQFQTTSRRSMMQDMNAMEVSQVSGGMKVVGGVVGGIAGLAAGALGGEAAGAAIGATIGSIIPGAGTLAGALLGGAIGSVWGSDIGGIIGGTLGSEILDAD
jgi:hypothetical protein